MKPSIEEIMKDQMRLGFGRVDPQAPLPMSHLPQAAQRPPPRSTRLACRPCPCLLPPATAEITSSIAGARESDLKGKRRYVVSPGYTAPPDFSAHRGRGFAPVWWLKFRLSHIPRKIVIDYSQRPFIVFCFDVCDWLSKRVRPHLFQVLQ